MVDLQDVVLDREVVDRVQTWLSSPRGVLVLWHPLGCGVSTMLRALETHVDAHTAFIWELPRDIATVAGSRHTVLGQRKVLVLDGIDHFFGTDPNVTKRFLGCLDDRPLPILLAGGHRRVTKAKVSRALRPTDTQITVPPLTPEAVSRVLGPLVADPVALFDQCSRDFRHAYEWAVGRGGHIKDTVPDGLPALEYLLRHDSASHIPSMDFSGVVRMVDGDAAMLLDGAFENYVHAIDGDLTGACDILDLMGRCDVMHARVYVDPSSEYPELSTCLAGVHMHIPHGSRRRGSRLTKPITTFGSVWANTNHMFAKKHHLRALSLAGKGLECPRPPLDMQCMRRMLLADVPRQAPRMHSLLGQEDTPLWHLFSQVWKSGRSGPSYTKAALVDAARPLSRRGTKRSSSSARS